MEIPYPHSPLDAADFRTLASAFYPGTSNPGRQDAGIRFHDLCTLRRRFGFDQRIKGSPHIFARDGVEEILNLQPNGSMAKPCQVKPVRKVLVQHKLVGEEQ
jgi:hypothetical protein